MRAPLLLLAAAASLPVVALVACGSDPKPTPQTANVNAPCPPPPGYPGGPPPGCTVTAGPSVSTPPPPVTGSVSGSASSSAAPSSSMATPMTSVPALTQLMAVAAAGETYGLKSEGPALAADFKPGQLLEQSFTIEANKCYTLVAVGTPTIEELDARFELLFPPGTVVARDPLTGSKAVVGGQKSGGCWRNPTPFTGPGKLVITVTRGAGQVAAQLYAK